MVVGVDQSGKHHVIGPPDLFVGLVGRFEGGVIPNLFDDSIPLEDGAVGEDRAGFRVGARSADDIFTADE